MLSSLFFYNPMWQHTQVYNVQLEFQTPEAAQHFVQNCANIFDRALNVAGFVFYFARQEVRNNLHFTREPALLGECKVVWQWTAHTSAPLSRQWVLSIVGALMPAYMHKASGGYSSAAALSATAAPVAFRVAVEQDIKLGPGAVTLYSNEDKVFRFSA